MIYTIAWLYIMMIYHFNNEGTMKEEIKIIKIENIDKKISDSEKDIFYKKLGKYPTFKENKILLDISSIDYISPAPLKELIENIKTIENASLTIKVYVSSSVEKILQFAGFSDHKKIYTDLKKALDFSNTSSLKNESMETVLPQFNKQVFQSSSTVDSSVVSFVDSTIPMPINKDSSISPRYALNDLTSSLRSSSKVKEQNIKSGIASNKAIPSEIIDKTIPMLPNPNDRTVLEFQSSNDLTTLDHSNFGSLNTPANSNISKNSEITLIDIWQEVQNLNKKIVFLEQTLIKELNDLKMIMKANQQEK